MIEKKAESFCENSIQHRTPGLKKVSWSCKLYGVFFPESKQVLLRLMRFARNSATISIV
jgi:hypothetical protein